MHRLKLLSVKLLSVKFLSASTFIVFASVGVAQSLLVLNKEGSGICFLLGVDLFHDVDHAVDASRAAWDCPTLRHARRREHKKTQSESMPY